MQQPNVSKRSMVCRLLAKTSLKTERQCEICQRRSDWDFLREFYQREDVNRQQVHSLNDKVIQLNNALQHAGMVSQKDRQALNNSHEHTNRLHNALNESNSARARIENDLHNERQEHRMTQESLTHERVRLEDTERSLACIWNSHKRLGDIVSNIECQIDDGAPLTHSQYNITEIVFELEAKLCKVTQLETDLHRQKAESSQTISQMEEEMRTANTKHEEEIVARDINLSNLELRLNRQHLRSNPEHTDGGQRGHGNRRRHRGRARREGQGHVAERGVPEPVGECGVK